MSRMVERAAAVAQARRVFERRYRDWAVAAATGAPPAAPALELPLHPPTEAVALAAPDEAAAWVRQWRAEPAVQWERRRWASAGTQELPVRLLLDDAVAVARFAGTLPRWRLAVARAGALLEVAGRAGVDNPPAPGEAVRRALGGVVDLTESDFERLRAVLAFLGEHPDSGLYVRQLPIRGVDTKWIGAHRGLVTGLHRAFTGRPELGLAAPPDLVRVRFLDAAAAGGGVPGGLADVSAPVPQWDTAAVAARVVLVVENLQTLLALPALPGAVVVHGPGYAVDLLAGIRWVRSARVLHWGDLDSHGFAILHRLRTHLPQAESVLMDSATLLGHRDLWVAEPSPARGALPLLTPAEAATLQLLRAEGDVRLEQERIAWAPAMAALRAAIRE